MRSLLLALLLTADSLSNQSPAVRQTTPNSTDPGMVVRPLGTVSVGGVVVVDGGYVVATQGGTWTVTVDSGSVSVSNFPAVQQVIITAAPPPLNPLLQRCNAVRRSSCQP